MTVSEATFQRVALEDPEGKWELHCGQLRSKPEMTTAHNRTARLLGRQLERQIDLEAYDIVVDQARVRQSASRYYIPDVFVVPLQLVRRNQQERPAELEAYGEPLPLVVEVWSPSTGAYDVEEKLKEYQRRGDTEIWRIHPYERTLTAWRRQPDGSYTESAYSDGFVHPASLPGVSIELAALFE